MYEIAGAPGTNKLYYKNGIAMFLLGQGKVNAALNTSAVLSDERFDFSDAYILSVGCGGAAKGYGIFGDVFVISAAVDFDLGHRADSRELGDKAETTWFHDESFDGSAVVRLDQSYRCTDPFAITEMEDVAVGQAVKSFGLLERLIILRVGVNMDVFPAGMAPEMLWGADADDYIASEDSMESVDIFETAMKNCFDVGKVLIDTISEGTL